LGLLLPHPTINPPTTLLELLSNANQTHKFLATCNEEGRKLIKEVYKPKESVFIAIGPEGDFSPKEIEAATNNNFQKITFGKERLRTETAGVYAAASIHLLNQ
jgi:16S rRNA (uracil1498-N3)-methyltransferase